MIAALLPPSSKMLRAKRLPQASPTARPMRVEPVAETRAIRVSATSAAPASARPISTLDKPTGAA